MTTDVFERDDIMDDSDKLKQYVATSFCRCLVKSPLRMTNLVIHGRRSTHVITFSHFLKPFKCSSGMYSTLSREVLLKALRDVLNDGFAPFVITQM